MYYTALIGNPVEHSVSPLMYEYFGAQAGLEYRHLKIEVAPDNLDASLRALQTLGFLGINVTLPFKQDVQPYLDHLDESARACGAVNTITVTEDGLTGYNTDWTGIVEGLRTHGVAETERAVVFGSGGAARAAIYALRQLGSKHIAVLYREPVDEKTQQLLRESERLGIHMHTYDDLEKVITGADVICNMTSTGMKGQPETPFALQRLETISIKAGAVFLDAVFNPVDTPLLQYFAQRGCTTVDGLWMMLYQGVDAFEHWTGRKLKISEEQLTELHTKLKEAVTHD